jgi:hypothetical protein
MMLDKMTAAGDRQRAHYKLEELERDVAKLEKEQSQHQEDLERIDRNFEDEKQKRIDAITKAEKALAEKPKRNPMPRPQLLRLLGCAPPLPEGLPHAEAVAAAAAHPDAAAVLRRGSSSGDVDAACDAAVAGEGW